MAASFTAEEVAKHKSKTDCWLIINDQVYDVTPYLDEHPGSGEILVDHSGADVTKTFLDFGHSDSAKSLMKRFHIGSLVKSTHSLPAPWPCNARVVAVAAAVAVIGIAGAVYLYKKKRSAE